MNILVVGQGGREHAILTALADSPGDHTLYSFPGSDAIFDLAKPTTATDLPSLMEFMKAEGIDLCVAGEESYLVTGDGLADCCERQGIPCWGPHKRSAQLEASKEFAKEFMVRHGIPTGGYSGADSRAEAEAAIGGNYPVVLKFDGLAAGKGVAVCTDEAQASAFLDEVYNDVRFGDGRVLIEECLSGPEISIFVSVVDSEYQILASARDYKRIGDNDEGDNTGGMGAVSSRTLADPALLTEIEETMIKPTVAGLIADELPYRGFLYFGIMLTPDGPKMLEYNCRFGDPECQAVMPLVKGDLASYIHAGAQGNLTPDALSFDEGWSVCLILASAGYPATSSKGDPISGLDDVENARIYHAGTRKTDEGYETNGGRVLAIVAGGDTREEAVTNAYAQANKVTFPGVQRRTDIGTLHFEDA